MLDSDWLTKIFLTPDWLTKIFSLLIGLNIIILASDWSGWCEVPGCKTKFYYWIAAMGVLSILGCTSRVGNVLVALRCVEVRDKALSFAFQVSRRFGFN